MADSVVDPEFLRRRIAQLEGQTPPSDTAPLHGGGGGGRFDDMEPRVVALEKAVDRIERKLDSITDSLQRVGLDVAEIKGKLPALASSADVVAVSTGLNDKPSTWQMVIITLVLSGLTVAAALGGAAKLLGK